jgi:hypothetical protein
VAVPRFKVGDAVTVRRGTRDPDFPDIPLGGWTGAIREVGSVPEVHYLIAWNDYTLANMHPVFRQRCLRDDLEMESMWLPENDLEPMPGMQPALEQPGSLTPRPLRLDNPADRIRAALGLTSDDPLPSVDTQTLRRYHAYLTERLAFPISAEFIDEEAGFAVPPLPVEIVRLWPAEELDPAQGIQAEVREGKQVFLVPLASLIVRGDGRALGLIQDYAAWYTDWTEQQGGPFRNDDAELTRTSIPGFAGRMTLYGAGCGACVGAVLGTIPQAGAYFLAGAFLMGVLGYLAGAKFGGTFDLTTGTIRRSLVGTLFATFAGVAIGGVLGVLVVAYVGTLLGSMAFHLLGLALDQLKVRILTAWAWTVLGAFLGALVYTLVLDHEAATNGALVGAGIGGGGVLILMIGFVIFAALLGRDEEPPE